jgi:hypothetical protein
VSGDNEGEKAVLEALCQKEQSFFNQPLQS